MTSPAVLSPAVLAPPSERPIVLLVDDQPIIGEAVRRILAPHKDIEFHFCQKGQDALATAARIGPTVILQDLVMPDADGLELVSGYRKQEATKLTPLIVLSSKEEGSTKADAFARGANDYIVKLPDPVELAARIRYHSRGYLSLLQRNQAFEALRVSQELLAKELAKAAQYVRSILPPPATAPVAIDWRFVPSESLGGDCFDYFWIDEDHLAIHIVDVCGHGVGPALLSVSVMNLVRSSAGGVDLRDPTAVLTQLNASFQMQQHGLMYFTMWYGVYRKSDRTIRFSGGGHPPPLLMSRAGDGAGVIRMLESPSLPIGIMEQVEFPTLEQKVDPGSSLLLYSDGAIEVFPSPGVLWGVSGLEKFMGEQVATDPACLDRLQSQVKQYSGSEVLDDDFSIVLAQLP